MFDDSLSTYCKYNPKSLRCLKEDYSLSIDIDIQNGDGIDGLYKFDFGIIGVKEKDQVIVTFENNGPKIPDEIVTSIFNKFYTTKAKKSGSGLGLSIVKNVLREHKANIKIESTENMTKFIITFEI